MDIYLIRHSKPDITDGICYGQADILPDSSFDQTVLAIKEKLAGAQLDAVFSSPLKRCSLLGEKLGCEIRRDDRLMEVSFGDWELKPWSGIDQQAVINWGNHYITAAPPNGETFHQLYNRVMSFWQDISQQQYQRPAIITHSGVIRAILAHLQETPLHKAFVIKPNYGCVIRITHNPPCNEIEFL